METTFERLQISDRKVIVAIDFGTTYSGIAWAETRQPARQTTITAWPTSSNVLDGKNSEKVPTKLRYHGNRVAQWGFQVSPLATKDEVVEHFKLDLDPSFRPSSSLSPLNGRNRFLDSEKCVTDYLEKLGQHLQYTLTTKLGQAFMRSTPFEFMLTVPAIWSELATQRTLRACMQAGTLFKDAKIHVISEPEAAAIKALSDLDPHALKVGDSFVVCDAGGGTVDLISYTIAKLRPILEVKEAAPGQGGLCGSSFLNQRFESFLQAKLGDVDGFDEEVMADAMQGFEEQAKRAFNMSTMIDEKFPIPVPGMSNNKSLGIKRGKLFITAADLHNIFEPIILKVIQLVEDQIRCSKVPIRSVVLVGGFGCSTYLRERLHKALQPRTRILQAPNAWLCVVNGALMKGLANSVQDFSTPVLIKTRVARKHLGVKRVCDYHHEKHSAYAKEKYYSPRKGNYRVDLMRWFIQKGDMVSEDEPFSKSLHRHIRVDHNLSVRCTIYADKTRRPAQRPQDASVRVLCWITADLNHIPKSTIPTSIGADGHFYYDLKYKLEWVYFSRSTVFTLVYQGQRYNTVTVEYV